MIIISRIIPKVGSARGAMVPKTQTNQNQISQRKTVLKESPLEPADSFSDLTWLSLDFLGSASPDAACGVGHDTEIPLLR